MMKARQKLKLYLTKKELDMGAGVKNTWGYISYLSQSVQVSSSRQRTHVGIAKGHNWVRFYV